MSRWNFIVVAALAVGFSLLPLHGGAAEDEVRQSELLHLDGPRVAVSALDHENLYGLGISGQGLLSRPADFSVILWDEVKPGQPSSPSPQSAVSGQGQGMSSFSGSSR